jgi:very-short-patch-repair endonuclease
LELAKGQAGVLTRKQAAAAGLTDNVVKRLVSQGAWRRLVRGVFALTPDTWLQRAWAGVLLGGTNAVLGNAAAGHLQLLVSEPPGRIDIYVGRSGNRHNDPSWRFIRADRSGGGRPPRTSPPQTVVDLAAELDSTDQLAAMVSRAIVHLRVAPEAILAAMPSRHRHRELLGDLVRDVSGGAHSPLEIRYLKDVERAHGLPISVRQSRTAVNQRSDVHYSVFGVIVELDGQAYHSGTAASRDLDRDNRQLIQGRTTLRFTWRQVVDDPCHVASAVGAALMLNGWLGPLRPCRRCPATQSSKTSPANAA